MDTDELKKALKARKGMGKKLPMLSCGCTLLNCANSGNPHGSFAPGGFYLLVGDSSSGKTVLAGTLFAEAALSKYFSEYDFIFDQPENGALMFEKFFGARIAAMIKAPEYDKQGNPKYSRTVEDFYYNTHKHMRSGKPKIYVLDSENALSSEAEIKKQAQRRKALEENDDKAAGTMTDAKAKVHSQNLRGLIADLQETGSILIMISQSRDNMGFGAKFEPKTRAGGRALKFYAMLEMWSSVKTKLKKPVRGKQRKIGIICRVNVKKNRFTGRDRTVDVPIYNSFGFDDIGSCIDWLIEERHWKKKEGLIIAPEFKFKCDRETFIKRVEERNLEHDLRDLVGEVWSEIEQELEVIRKPRYV